MKLYILRHGETDWNKVRRVQGATDIPLNEYGKYLARETAKGFQDVEIDIVYTSPLIRAKETAQLVLEGKQYTMIEDARIREICFGGYEGICFAGPNKVPESSGFHKFFIDTENYVPIGGGESVRDIMDRTGDFLKEIYSNPEIQDKNILISTHGAAMTALLNHIRNNLEVKNYWCEEVPPNCAVTIVEVKNGIPEILAKSQVYYNEPVNKWTVED
ncbi:MAG: histidine phosphatase family protein [Schaedlerella sp.]|nr:histidine phosphatase family protein [Schaedlerella sp.]